MRVAVMTASRLKKAALLILCTVSGAGLLLFPQAAAGGVSRGLSICGQLLIPSLFPFLVLSSFLVRSGIAAAVGRRLAPAMRVLFGLPGCAAAAIVISFCGGYPAGGTAVGELVQGGYMTRQDGKRLLRFCVNGGPAFILCGVGAGMLGSIKAGVLLLIAHILAALIVALLSRKSSQTGAVSLPAAKPQAPAAAFVGGVHAACEALLSMCGFVLIAAAVLALFDASGASEALYNLLAAPFRAAGQEPRMLKALFPSLIEVSCGCVEAAGVGATAPFWLGFALGWGGLSVHGQLAAALQQLSLIDAAFFRARLLHGLLGGILSALLFRWFPVPPAAVSAGTAVLSSLSDNSIAGTTALLLMCVLFLVTLTPHLTVQKRR